MEMSEEDSRVTLVEGAWSAAQAARDIIAGGADEPFYISDLRELATRHARWRALMPRVELFYAVKCNADKMLLRTLAALGAGFDCASRGEIERVAALGVPPQRIIYANTSKNESHLRYATSAGVDLMTFDSEAELVKIKQHAPRARLVLRIRCDAVRAQLSLGVRFGCDPHAEAPALLRLAAELGLDVIGVSFHIGSGAAEPAAYARGVALCRAVFSAGAAAGLARMRLVDVGGGFAGHSGSSLHEVAAVINAALEQHFPEPGVRVIAEPGRYFAAAAYTLAVMVHGKKEISKDECGPHTMYCISDGVFNSFNAVLTAGETVEPTMLHPSQEAPQPCSIWGQTCNPLDCVVPSISLPPLAVGSWLLFRDMGAYTLAVNSGFNGFTAPRVITFADQPLWSLLKSKWPLLERQHEQPRQETSAE